LDLVRDLVFGSSFASYLWLFWDDDQRAIYNFISLISLGRSGEGRLKDLLVSSSFRYNPNPNPKGRFFFLFSS